MLQNQKRKRSINIGDLVTVDTKDNSRVYARVEEIMNGEQVKVEAYLIVPSVTKSNKYHRCIDISTCTKSSLIFDKQWLNGRFSIVNGKYINRFEVLDMVHL